MDKVTCIMVIVIMLVGSILFGIGIKAIAKQEERIIELEKYKCIVTIKDTQAEQYSPFENMIVNTIDIESDGVIKFYSKQKGMIIRKIDWKKAWWDYDGLVKCMKLKVQKIVPSTLVEEVE